MCYKKRFYKQAADIITTLSLLNDKTNDKAQQDAAHFVKPCLVVMFSYHQTTAVYL
jgi:3-keto-L-gulonate-6-phosphate decarboxylase